MKLLCNLDCSNSIKLRPLEGVLILHNACLLNGRLMHAFQVQPRFQNMQYLLLECSNAQQTAIFLSLCLHEW